MKFCLLLFVLLTAGLGSYGGLRGIVYETGSFSQFLFGTEPNCEYDNWISHIAEGLAAPGYNLYAPWDRQTNGFGSFHFPDSTQIQYWQNICSNFVTQDWNALHWNLLFSGIPYQLVQFTDTDTDRIYYLLRESLNDDTDDNGTDDTADDETGSFDFGWGLMVYNPHAESPVIITVPHPNDDFIAPVLAWKAFITLNARYLLISGAGREVAWTNVPPYTNSRSLSDPSRNQNHPLHNLYKECCNEIRRMLVMQRSPLEREFSLQVHSYDWTIHIGYSDCQVSAGAGRTCPNLPVRDLSLTVPDMINAAGYQIHQQNSIGIHPPVLTTDFWAVYYNRHPFVFNDGVHYLPVSSHIDLPGYSLNCQMLYSLQNWNDYDVFDPFLHIEMNELPDCYAQNDSLFRWFYGYDYESGSWNINQRYQRVLQYYTPWVDALNMSLIPTLALNDHTTPQTPVLSLAEDAGNGLVRLRWERIYEYDFHSWEIVLTQLENQARPSSRTEFTYTRSNKTDLADAALQDIVLTNLPSGFNYLVRIRALDKSARYSGFSNQIIFYLASPPPVVTNLTYNRSQSTENQISLFWTPIQNNLDVTGYRLEKRRINQTEWSRVVDLPPGSSSYTESGFSYDDVLPFYYRLKVLTFLGIENPPSNECFAWLRCYEAPDITGFQVTGEVLTMQWNHVSRTLGGVFDQPDYYQVMSSSSPGFDEGELVSEPVIGAQFQQPLNPAYLRMFYLVRAKAGVPSSR